jgi:hypothetical protein
MNTRSVLTIVAGLTFAILGIAGCGKEPAAQPATPSPQAANPKPVFPGQTPPATPPPAIVQGGTPKPTQPADPPPSTEVKPTDSPVTPASNAMTSAPIPGAGAASAQDNRVAAFAGLTAPKPATWIWHPTQAQFSVAEYTVPGVEGADQAKITVFSAGGSLDANIARWRMQFRDADGNLGGVDPVVESFEADGMPVSIVEFDGDYKGMGMSNFATGQKFITAVVDAPTQKLFIRFVGPSKTVGSNRSAFLDMIKGLRAADPQK